MYWWLAVGMFPYREYYSLPKHEKICTIKFDLPEIKNTSGKWVNFKGLIGKTSYKIAVFFTIKIAIEK